MGSPAACEASATNVVLQPCASLCAWRSWREMIFGRRQAGAPQDSGSFVGSSGPPTPRRQLWRDERSDHDLHDARGACNATLCTDCSQSVHRKRTAASLLHGEMGRLYLCNAAVAVSCVCAARDASYPAWELASCDSMGRSCDDGTTRVSSVRSVFHLDGENAETTESTRSAEVPVPACRASFLTIHAFR